jgi:hypothetical protein
MLLIEHPFCITDSHLEAHEPIYHRAGGFKKPLIKRFDCVLKGHGFSRADMAPEGSSWALALEGVYFQRLASPHRLKPTPFFVICGTAEAVPFQDGN